jgi:hypothetical protein
MAPLQHITMEAMIDWTGSAAGASPLSPAREAGGAEDRLRNSGHRDWFDGLPWPR